VRRTVEQAVHEALLRGLRDRCGRFAIAGGPIGAIHPRFPAEVARRQPALAVSLAAMDLDGMIERLGQGGRDTRRAGC
jgi:hypothetical protein